MEGLRNLAARVDGLSVRERALIMATVLVVLYLLWDTALMHPLDMRQFKLSDQLATTRVEIDTLNREAAVIIARQGEDPDADNRAQLDVRHQELAELKLALQEAARRLVPAEEMANLLETVLRRSRGVQFLRLEGLGANSILEDLPTVSGAETAPGAGGTASRPAVQAAFKHGLLIEFEGGYLEALSVLRELEDLPWVFFWDSVKLGVEEYPTARLAITVFTLSWNRAWIGV